jgi:uncharacterized protein
MAIRIAAEEARRLALSLQGLAEPPRRKLGADALIALIERLGFVQVDSVNVVARAHHMILFARNQTYRPALLQRLLEREARLFESWTHDAAIIPTRFYPYWQVRFDRDRGRLAQRYREWFGGRHEERVEAILAHVRQNGAVMARAFRDPERPRGGFWDWHPDKAALELLWRTGRLAIARRQGFQKVYDLAERVIPAAARASTPSHAAFVDWACRSALQRLGFATPAQIAGFWDLVTLAEARQWCASHPDRAVPAVLEPADGSGARPVLARDDIADLLQALPACPGRVRVLSPFDPLLRDRRRLLALFNFDYRIEIFVPAKRRRHGYCVFPLLEGERLIGRIDMKRNTASRLLEVMALWLEPGLRPSRGRHDRIAAELDRIRRFIGADAVRYVDDFARKAERIQSFVP